jgi:hypothetical protein
MDNTGSMRGTKMTGMKDAATELVDILYGSREEVPQFWVGVVPYAANVNIGTQHADWLTGYDPDAFLPTEWKGCVEARSFPNDSNDEPPDTEQWTAFRWASTLRQYENPHWSFDPDEYVVVVEDDSEDWDDPNNVVFRQGEPDGAHPEPEVVEYRQDPPATWGRWLNGDNQWDPDGPESALKLDNDLYQNEGTGPNLGCGPAITPLVASKTTVQAAIDEMAPWHRGGTMANLGLAWGWRVLSPRWRNLWDGDLPAELPLDYDEPNMEKVVILLTDGNNEWYDYPGIEWTTEGQKHYTGIPGANKYPGSYGFSNTWPGADYTAYGRLNEGRLGTTNKTTANAILDDRMLDMCQTMKGQDIIIYTLTFGGSPNAATQQLYRDCATEPDMYFHAPSNSELQQAFVQIADELSALRIAE